MQDYNVRVFTTDGIWQETRPADTMDEGYQLFDELCALYIDTEGQPFGSGGYVVQFSNSDGNVIAEDTQESYISE